MQQHAVLGMIPHAARKRTAGKAVEPAWCFRIARFAGAREAPSMDASLLDLVCCPETHQPLRFATADELARLSSAPPIEAALLREDERVAYPVRDGIPLLVIEEQIALA